MAYLRLSLVPTLILFVFSSLFGQDLRRNADEVIDSTFSDTSAVVDSAKVKGKDILGIKAGESGEAEVDSTVSKKIMIVPETGIPPYYRTYILSKGHGDYLKQMTGIVSLQHGPVGQPEILTKSILLGGLNAIYNGAPVFQQGFYFPYRRGLDLNILMFENSGWIGITPLAYLDLFSEGETFSLKSMVWPDPDNPSSVTVARGAYDYERSAWRFSRWIGHTMAASFTAGFKKSHGYYQSGTDYDGFAVSGTVGFRPRSNSIFSYTFYRDGSKKEILQFDRVIAPTLRVNNDIDHHTLKGKYRVSETSQFELTLFHQKNYGHLYDDDTNYHHRIRDFIWGGEAMMLIDGSKHNLRFKVGGSRHYVGGLGTDAARSVTAAVLLQDSLVVGNNENLIISVRARQNNINEFTVSAVGSYNRSLKESFKLSLSGGLLDFLPDIYSMYYNLPLLSLGSAGIYESYSFRADRSLNHSQILFAQARSAINFYNRLSFISSLSLEKVADDILHVTRDSSAAWVTFPQNIDYNRLTLSMSFDYSIANHFEGSTGLTYILHDPEIPMPGLKHSPAETAYSRGKFTLTQVLRDIDLAGVYQLRYIGAREYSGFITESYEPALALDGAVVVRFGSFKFELIQENILDYLGDNKYNIWGEYVMPPASVWWQFTWDFIN